MARPLIKNVVGVLVLVLLAIVEATTPPGIANNPSHARCLIKKYKMCYNLEHVCPKFCPDSCTVECVSCKPICGGGSSPPPDTEAPSPPDHGGEGKTSPPSGGDDNDKGGKGKSPPPSDGDDDDKGGKGKSPPPSGGDDHDDDGAGGKGKSPPPSGGDDDDKGGKGKSPPPSDGDDDDKGGKGKSPPPSDGDDGDDNGKGKPPKSSPPPKVESPPPTSPPPATPTPTPSPPEHSPPPSSPPPTPTTPKPSPPSPTLSPPPVTPTPTPSPPSTPTTPPSSPPPTPATPTPSPPSTPTTPPSSPPPTPATPTPSPPTSPPPTSSPEYPPPTPTTPPQSPPSPSPPLPTPSPNPTPSSPPPPLIPVTPSPSPPTPSTPPASPPPHAPYPPPQSPGDSSEAAAARRRRCRNKNYPQCYGVQHVCPSSCPNTCEVDCVTCKPVCKCDMPGAVCQDPRFIGGDGVTFYFHGKKDKDFCLVTESNFQINAHFIGRRNPNMKRDFTWVQSIGILFGDHKLFIGAQKTATWDDAFDRLAIAFDSNPIALPTTDGSEAVLSPTTTITRDSDTNSVIIEVKNLFKISAKVVPITKQESKVHNYGITEEDSFAHLELGFKFYALTGSVNGVLGQTYGENYVSRAKMGVAMPVLGGEKEFAVSNIFATDCAVSKFVAGEMSPENDEQFMLELPSMQCGSGIDGRGVVCKK